MNPIHQSHKRLSDATLPVDSLRSWLLTNAVSKFAHSDRFRDSNGVMRYLNNWQPVTTDVPDNVESHIKYEMAGCKFYIF